MAMGTAISGTILAVFLVANGGVEKAGGPKPPWIPSTRFALYVLVVLSLLAAGLSIFRIAGNQKPSAGQEHGNMPLEW
jgi:hypothetical protein